MKTLILSLTAVVAVVFLGSCDKHSFERTKVLHEKYQAHERGSHEGAAEKHEGGEAKH